MSYDSIYKKVQKIAHQMISSAQRRGVLRGWQGGKCVDCGDQNPWQFVDEHRDYSDPYAIETVCQPCNAKRGPALLMLFNVETAEWIQISPHHFTVRVNTRYWTLKKLLREGIVTKASLTCTPIRVRYAHIP